MESKKKVIIIGGGPAGLTAAYEFLKHTDLTPIVIEKSEYWGGISRTVDYKGNKIDIGGHRFFSKSDLVMEWWNEILPIFSEDKNVNLSYQNKSKEILVSDSSVSENQDNILLVRKRKSRIFYNDSFFEYPISLSFSTLKNIGFTSSIEIGFSYLKSVIKPIKEEVSLEDFLINRFGKKLYLTFFKDYTEKVWGVSCDEISAEWGAQRIKGLSIRKALIHFVKNLFRSKNVNINQKKIETSLIEYFLYPKFGPGQMWEEVAKKVEGRGVLLKKSNVIGIQTAKNNLKSVTIQNVITNEIQVIEADYFISTMPVKELINKLDCFVPENVKNIANGLQYRDFITVGLLLKKMNHVVEDNWIYIQEPSVKVGRLQIFNNWSPHLVQNKETIWVGMEYFCNEGDHLWNKTDDEFIKFAIYEMIKINFINEDDVLDATIIRMPKTYPAYFGTYSEFDTVKDFTDSFTNLFLIGRNGMHKYNNQDHSMLTAIQAVENIKNNCMDKSNIWSINTEQEFHEEK